MLARKIRKPAARLQVPRRWLVGVGVGLFGALIAGCDGLTDVENPNVVVQSDVESSASASALVNGALRNTVRGLDALQAASETISDHLVWLGTFDDVGDLDRGELFDDGSRYQEDSYERLAVGRWMSDEAIRLLEGFDAEGELSNRNLLARVYFYSAINYAFAADMFEDFVVGDRQDIQPPLGGDNLSTLYDIALQRLERTTEIAQQTGNENLQLAALALSARIHWARELWHKMRPRQTPGDPLIDNAQANALALEFLRRAPADWRFQTEWLPGEGESYAGHQINSRREVTFDAHLAEHDPSGRAICSPFNSTCSHDGIRLMDPVDEIQDPALRRFLWEFIGQGASRTKVTVVSARELRLILAESALKRGDLTEFASQINAVRSLESELSPYSPQEHGHLDSRDLLIHTRKVNLILQPHRRLLDLYRFGIRAPRWSEAGEARRFPGHVLNMSRSENQANCWILLGAC